jgi:dTDP-4-amino-4,6-dideoxygalactose transaminase
MRIPYVNIAAQHALIKNELLSAMSIVIDNGQFILGDEVAEFEQRFAELCGVRYAVGLSSGTDALLLALKAVGIGPGDEVITVPNSFVASAACIALSGARPVFVDVRDDYNMDPTLIEQAITSRTRAILPVHLTGRPADMDQIMDIAKGKGLHIIEDCAQAVIAEYKGNRVGSFGRMGCFSLHPLKTLNACGDGGVLTTNDGDVAEQIRVLRNIGLKTRDDCVVWSGNSRLDTIQAAVLLVKLKYLEAWTEKRRANARFYQDHLANLPQVQLPSDKPHERAVYHTFIIQADHRAELQVHLARLGIGTAIHYPVPIHLQKAARNLGYGPDSYPVAERQAQRILSLPVYPELEEAELQYVVNGIRSFYEEK